jgi:hypothetical protein
VEARLIRKHKGLILFEVFFLLGILSFNGVATSLGWIPATELVRQARARTQRAGKKLREIFD